MAEWKKEWAAKDEKFSGGDGSYVYSLSDMSPKHAIPANATINSVTITIAGKHNTNTYAALRIHFSDGTNLRAREDWSIGNSYTYYSYDLKALGYISYDSTNGWRVVCGNSTSINATVDIVTLVAPTYTFSCSVVWNYDIPHTHSYTSTVTKQPTCGAAGVRTYTCSCGDSYTESIPATGNHNYISFTSNKDGNHTCTCSCGHTITEKCTIGEYTRIKEPTYSEAGTEQAYCTKCNQGYAKNIAALGFPVYINTERCSGVYYVESEKTIYYVISGAIPAGVSTTSDSVDGIHFKVTNSVPSNGKLITGIYHNTTFMK